MVIDNASFLKRITLVYTNLFSAGFDGTGFDRTVTAQSVTRSIKWTTDHTNCPESLQAFLAHVACYGHTQLPDGELRDTCGGNKSGIFLTGVINCLHFDCISTQVYSTYYQCPPAQVHDIVTLTITGDDSIHGFRKHPDLQLLLDLFGGFTTVFKLDCLEGRCFPPKSACHAPYLGRVSVDLGSGIITVPLEPRRNLARYHTPPDVTPAKFYDSLVGIRESLLPYLVAQTLNPDYPVPYCVSNFMDYFDEFRAEAILADRIHPLPLPIDLVKATEVCSPLWRE
jgi:hypothetical protein